MRDYQQQNTLLSLLSTALLALSLAVPRFFQSTEGLAGATSAAVTFIILFIVAALIALYLLIYTTKHFSKLSRSHRLRGFIPCILVCLVAIGIYLRL